MAGLYIISLRWAKERKDHATIELVLERVGTWLRFDQNTYLLHSKETAEGIFKQLGSIMTKADQELIFRVDRSDFSGWTAKWINDWIVANPLK